VINGVPLDMRWMARVTGSEQLRSLQLGMGWFPDEPGGLNRYVRGLFEALASLDANSRAVVLGPADSAPAGVTVAVDSDETLLRRLLAFARAAWRIPGPDVVDAHFAPYALLPATFGPLRKVPLVVHFHGPWALEGRKGGDRAWVSMVKALVEGAVYRRADEAVVLSRAFGRLLVERYGVSPWRVNVIPPGVDLERFSPGDRQHARQELGLSSAAWVVLTVRRLVARMGLEMLLDAWAGLSLDGGVLLIVGDGPLRAELEERSSDSVRFLGEVDDELLPTYYRAADVLVVPSESLEGFGLVVLEALACGTPVIVTDVGGLPETVKGFERDLIVPAKDPQALRQRLASAASGSRPLPKPQQARAHAKTFVWPDVAERHRAVYRRAVSGGRRRPLRVVYCDHTAALSGGELSLLRLLPALESVDAHVVLAEYGPLVRRLESVGVSVEVLPLADSVRDVSRRKVDRASAVAGAAAGTGLYALRLARRLRQLRPDLLHTNSLKSALYGGVAGRLSRTPVIWQIHDRVAPDYLGERGTKIVRSAARWMPTAVVANSLVTLSSLEVDGCVIPCPIAVGLAKPRGLNRSLTVGIVGRIARWKGQHVFLEAFAQAFPNGSERGVIIGAPLFGADEELYESELRELAVNLGLDGRVAFKGFVTDVAAELAQLDILVHASVLPEPFGQVIVEGMAAYVPVVATAAGGPLEFLDDGNDSVLYPAGDVDALASALRRLATDAGLRSRLGTAGQAKSRRFAPEVIAVEMTAAYWDVLGRR
jgi:glycosyltransferase involved in cell wall biosynthesis